jgi:hypothetical protein
MRRGRGGVEGVGKGVEDGGKHKGALSVTPLRSPPRVRLAGRCPGSLAKSAGAAPTQWPAHAIQTLPRWRWGDGWRCPNRHTVVIHSVSHSVMQSAIQSDNQTVSQSLVIQSFSEPK